MNLDLQRCQRPEGGSLLFTHTLAPSPDTKQTPLEHVGCGFPQSLAGSQSWRPQTPDKEDDELIGSGRDFSWTQALPIMACSPVDTS